MFDAEKDREEKALADALIAVVGQLDADTQRAVDQDMRAGEWANASISLLFFAADARRPIDRALVNSEAAQRWASEVGGLTEALATIPAA